VWDTGGEWPKLTRPASTVDLVLVVLLLQVGQDDAHGALIEPDAAHGHLVAAPQKLSSISSSIGARAQASAWDWHRGHSSHTLSPSRAAPEVPPSALA